MYVQEIFKDEQTDLIHELIENNPLGALTIHGAEGLSADHLPFFFDKAGYLETHVSSMNPITKNIEAGKDALVIFNGGDAYVSPSWMSQRYLSKKVQPTWVYAVVHVYCTIDFFTNDDRLQDHLEKAVNFFEQNMDDPWSISEAPAGFISNLCQYIVGIRLNIKKVVAKFQLLQQRAPIDRQGAVVGLRAAGNYKSSFMATLIENYNGSVNL